MVVVSEVSPAPISLEERGGCHCYGNLIYHKGIPFVTWPNSKGRAALNMHTLTLTHTLTKEKQGSGEGRMKKVTQGKEWAACLLPQLSTFGKDSLKQLGSPSSLSLQGTSEMGSGPKTKAQERHGRQHPLHNS